MRKGPKRARKMANCYVVSACNGVYRNRSLFVSLGGFGDWDGTWVLIVMRGWDLWASPSFDRNSFEQIPS